MTTMLQGKATKLNLIKQHITTSNLIEKCLTIKKHQLPLISIKALNYQI